MRKSWFFVFFSLGFICSVTEHTNAATSIAADTPFCLHFTWLGPLYDMYSTVNVTCANLTGTPCIEPFVVTTDGSEPNITYLWENHNHSVIGCPLRSGFSCIKYTYTFNDAVMNASYFCGKMIADASDPLTTGCYTEDTGGYTVEACACRTSAGETPCNASTMNVASFLTQSILILLLIFYFSNI